MKKIKTKNILVTVGIVILLAVIVYVRSRISPLFGNYSVEKNEKKVEAKPTMDTKSQVSGENGDFINRHQFILEYARKW